MLAHAHRLPALTPSFCKVCGCERAGFSLRAKRVPPVTSVTTLVC